MGGGSAYGLPNFTHAWAPLDRGHIMAVIKPVCKSKFEQYMKFKSIKQPDKFNWQLWEFEKMTQMDKTFW